MADKAAHKTILKDSTGKTIGDASGELVLFTLLGNVGLLKMRGRSIMSQLDELRRKGLKMGKSTFFTLISKGCSRRHCSTFYLAIFAEYWGLPVADLYYIGREFEAARVEGREPDVGRFGIDLTRLR